MSKVLDLTGKKINKWTVLSRAENNSRGGSMWLCECECGSFDYLNKNNFKNTKKRDEYKNNWCKENNIPLIRIKYTQLNNLKLEDLLL